MISEYGQWIKIGAGELAMVDVLGPCTATIELLLNCKECL
ncbi:hypothetical protein TREPR_3666 [Treponema primitia ZAS-2]|uniref:Uncharacterized protein n=1 Tax=Treponema primitia (strain ATCC BAA-887 / DSM 12427 / ZAS-2) TaxID=545694 RepID=F5YQF8_TREPZ|nr:hypothetical protein TREPR_3666 [Treponema primitia ZAS-2]